MKANIILFFFWDLPKTLIYSELRNYLKVEINATPMRVSIIAIEHLKYKYILNIWNIK